MKQINRTLMFVTLFFLASRPVAACQELLQSDIYLGRGTTLLYFYAPGCSACADMDRPFDEVSRELIKKYGISTCYRINVSGAGAELADAFSIRTVPTTIIIHKVDAVFDNPQELRAELEPLMRTLAPDEKVEPAPTTAIDQDEQNLLETSDEATDLAAVEAQPELTGSLIDDTAESMQTPLSPSIPLPDTLPQLNDQEPAPLFTNPNPMPIAPTVLPTIHQDESDSPTDFPEQPAAENNIVSPAAPLVLNPSENQSSETFEQASPERSDAPPTTAPTIDLPLK